MLALRHTCVRFLRISASPCLRLQNSFSAAAEQLEKIEPPPLEGSEKTFHPKIAKIVDDISQLNLIEVADLNELLKIKLNISDVPMMAAGPAALAGPAQTEDEGPIVKEQTEFAVKLTAFNADSKIKLIKAIKTLIPDLNLVKAKSFVETLPQVVRREIPKEEADDVLKVLTEAGGTASIE